MCIWYEAPSDFRDLPRAVAVLVIARLRTLLFGDPWEWGIGLR
jgi:hypothetical protein